MAQKKKKQENKQTFAFCFQSSWTEPKTELSWRAGESESRSTGELERGSQTKYLTGKLSK